MADIDRNDADSSVLQASRELCQSGKASHLNIQKAQLSSDVLVMQTGPRTKAGQLTFFIPENDVWVVSALDGHVRRHLGHRQVVDA